MKEKKEKGYKEQIYLILSLQNAEDFDRLHFG